MNYLLLAIVVLIWGPNMGIVKSAYQDFHPILFAAIRFTLSGILMLMIVLWKEKNLRIRKVDWGRLVAVGAMGIGLYQILWSMGLNHTSATNSALIGSAQPLMGVLYVDLTKKESVTRRQYGGMLLALGGVALVVLKPTAHLSFSLGTLLGDLLTLMAGCCMAVFFSAWSKPLLQVYTPIRVMAYSMAISSIVLWGAVLLLGLPAAWREIGLNSWYAFGYAVVLSGMLGHVLWYESISRIGISKTMVYLYFIPIWAVLFNHFFMGEKVFVQQLLGGLLILWGVRSALRN